MLDFVKKSDYLVCIDSDGTVMDTMTVKHEKAFGPCFLTVFEITEHREAVLHHWNEVNLYSRTRGINRFQGLNEICHYIQTSYGMNFRGLDEFDDWVKKTKEFSTASIRKQMESAADTSFFKKALDWSDSVNRTIAQLPPSLPFDGVKEGLEKAFGNADLVGVSSANQEAVTEEWNRLDLMKYFAFVGCQNVGNKSFIIRNALENGYDKRKAVMLGDAEGDRKAALDNGIWFFPIIPGKENESWKQFTETGLPKLLNGTFDEEYQKQLTEAFHAILK